MRYMDCPIEYIERMGRTFQTRYKEHIQETRNNNGNSGYSIHILNTGYAYGNITDTMKSYENREKGKYHNTPERCHIYKMSKDGLQITRCSK
jgi:hypothetical protein